ncbi:MAG: hypothetical protein IJ684_05445 [Bacteroidales bacterium]|nr:hypothetical protein [Bacteroidales bacterium]
MISKHICIWCLLLSLVIGCTQAQTARPLPLVPLDESHSFVRYSANHLRFGTDSTLLQAFFRHWQEVASTGKGQVNIVHIGSSHVQAGTLPNAIRRNILQANPTLVGGRGMIFPYSAAAKCNNPADYTVHCPQRMALTRNVYKEPERQLGLCGIAVTAQDTLTYIDIVLNDTDIDYATRQVILLGEAQGLVLPYIQLGEQELSASFIDRANQRYIFNLPKVTDSFRLVLPCEKGESFSVTGLFLDNGKSGFTYHSIGVNGASLNDYNLKCPNLRRDLALLHPDLVIFGIGINDASGSNFDTAVFRQSYLTLIDSIRAVNPRCAFIFITNNDSYRRVKRKTYAVNTNGPLARAVFYRLAQETGGAVWDQFEVMGGLRSMERWRVAKLAQTDRVHFTRAGYKLIGDLFTNALFEALNACADKPKNATQHGSSPYISY